MPAIRIVHAHDFIETTVDGTLDLAQSRRLFLAIACANAEEQLDLLIDIRSADNKRMSYREIYLLLPALEERREAFAGKIALLDEYDNDGFAKAQFFGAAATLHGFQVRTFIDYEPAMRWLQADSTPVHTAPAIAPAQRPRAASTPVAPA